MSLRILDIPVGGTVTAKVGVRILPVGGQLGRLERRREMFTVKLKSCGTVCPGGILWVKKEAVDVERPIPLISKTKCRTRESRGGTFISLS